MSGILVLDFIMFLDGGYFGRKWYARKLNKYLCFNEKKIQRSILIELVLITNNVTNQKEIYTHRK